MSEKILEKEIKKIDYLIESAQQELDSANKSKAPKGTITHLKDRIEALEKRKKRFETALAKYQKPVKTEGQTKVKTKTTPPSGEKGADEEGDD